MQFSYHHLLYLALGIIALILLVLVIVYAQIVWFKYQNGDAVSNTKEDQSPQTNTDSQADISHTGKLEILNATTGVNSAAVTETNTAEKQAVLNNNETSASDSESEFTEAEKYNLLQN